MVQALKSRTHMKAKFAWLILFPIAMIFLGCGKQLPSEEPCNFVVNSASRRVSWVRMPVRFYVDDTLSDEQYYGIQAAMDVWNAQFDSKVFELIGMTTQLPQPILTKDGKVIADGYNGIYIVADEYFTNTAQKDEQARTSLSFRGDYIFEADILIDGSENFYIGDEQKTASEGLLEFKSLMIHELGHVLGLEHIEGPGNPVMQSKLRYGEVRHELSDADFESLACEYN